MRETTRKSCGNGWLKRMETEICGEKTMKDDGENGERFNGEGQGLKNGTVIRETDNREGRGAAVHKHRCALPMVVFVTNATTDNVYHKRYHALRFT